MDNLKNLYTDIPETFFNTKLINIYHATDVHCIIFKIMVYCDFFSVINKLRYRFLKNIL